MRVDFASLAPADRYKLLSGLVVPRPIALVTTTDDAGLVNAAPFSFFNVVSEDPPLLILGLQARADGSPKHTTRNIRRRGDFVVNLVDEALAPTMAACAIDFPEGWSEPDTLALALAPSIHVDVPRLADAPVALECRRETILSFGPERDVVVGRILGLVARDGVVDADTLRTDYAAYKPVGRLAGAGYVRLADRFTIPTPTFAAWTARASER